jgi:hypothetical protein
MLMFPVSVDRVADFLGCSTRRVRALLQQGRISGYKDNGAWVVNWPIQVTPGRRGPDLRRYAIRKVVKPSLRLVQGKKLDGQS